MEIEGVGVSERVRPAQGGRGCAGAAADSNTILFFLVFRDSVAFSTPIDVTVLMRWNLLKFAGQKNSSPSLES